MGEVQDTVFLGVPAYTDGICFDAAIAIFEKASKKRRVAVCRRGSSLLALNFNMLWCDALNSRDTLKPKWFAMLHGDIAPEDCWLDKLVDEAEANDADVMSAVVPFKDQSGYTSTALSDPSNPWAPFCRLTQKQVRAEYWPKTFAADDVIYRLEYTPDEHLAVHDAPRDAQLLVNTGCMVARIDRPWAEQVHFNIADRIIKNAGGQFEAQVQPEDWQFSRQVADLGGKVMATTKIDLQHRGSAAYASTSIWGRDRDHLIDAA